MRSASISSAEVTIPFQSAWALKSCLVKYRVAIESKDLTP